MRLLFNHLLILIVALSASFASAQTQPSAPELATPQAAFRTFLKGIQAADADAIRSVLYAADKTDAEYIAATVNMARQTSALEAAIAKRFGNDGVKAMNLGRPTDENIEQLGQAKVTIDGDKAQMTIDDPSAKFPPFVKRDGKWQIAVADIAAMSGHSTAEVSEQLKSIAQAMMITAKEVNDGQYQTIADIQQALQLHAMSLSPSTKP